MAPVTPATVWRANLGSTAQVTARFTTADDGDTWASGMSGIVNYMAQDRTNPATQASVGMAATESSGTFTFYPAEDGTAFDLIVQFKA
jgi:hypothetical protein